jgi:hypothetical protein
MVYLKEGGRARALRVNALITVDYVPKERIMRKHLLLRLNPIYY